MQDSEQRISGKMGKAGSADVEYSTDSARTPGKLPSRHRLGAVYRCSHPCRGAQDRPIVFLLWGRPAQMKKSMLHNPKHLILEAPHPSPLSAYRGFFGCKHFSQTNAFLEKNGLAPIDWQIEDV